MKKKVGTKIKSSNTNWTFDGKVYKNFDTHINKSVPLYLWAHEIGLDISDFFIKKNSNCYDLGCSTGTFLKKLALRNKKKKAKFYGVDEVKNMVKYAKKNCKNFKNIHFLNKDVSKINFQNCDFITSYYTIQFIKPSERQRLFNKIFKSLNWGGAFLFFEKVRAPDARFQDIMSLIYNEFKIKNGFSSSEIIEKSRSLKGVLDPFSSNENLLFLKRAGFKDYMSVFKFISFEGFIAIK